MVGPLVIRATHSPRGPASPSSTRAPPTLAPCCVYDRLTSGRVLYSWLALRAGGSDVAPRAPRAPDYSSRVTVTGSSPSRSSCARVESETPSLDFDEPQQVRNPLARCIAAEAHVAKIGNQAGWMPAPIGLFGAQPGQFDYGPVQ
jgi:hypothetical protein